MPATPRLVPPRLLDADLRRLGRFPLRLLSPDDAPAVLALRTEVLAHLEHPDLYVRESDEEAFVRRHLGGPSGEAVGETIGVHDGERLVAYAMLGLPDASDPHNLGQRVAAPPRTPADVAHIASCMVLPAYRGHGLQRTLLAARFSLAQAQGRALCIAMVSLHNHPSRQNMMREGMRIAWTGEIEGLRRQLLAIDLGQAWDFEADRAQLVPVSDFARQCELTAQGWWGIAEMPARGLEARLVFARHAPAPPGPT